MLRVTVEIVPDGVEDLRRTLGLMLIGNISNLANMSDYKVYVSEAANPLANTLPWVRKFTVSGHDRRQSVWKIVGRAIVEMDGVSPTQV